MGSIDAQLKMETNPFILQLNELNNNNEDENVEIQSTITDVSEESEGSLTLKGCPGLTSIIPLNDSSNFNEWYTYEHTEINACPFKSFHHVGLPSEFLQYPHYHTSDKRSQHILAGMGDHSSGICVKIQFIVNNLKDCQGIWAQLFLQKLNAIIVNADHVIVRAVLSKDDFTILKALIGCYANEKKCEMVFRYWCLMYNSFTKNLVPVLPFELKNKIMEQLQRDFSLAAQNLCRCKLDSQCCGERGPEEEDHKMISGLTQMNIIAVLMHYLVCKVGDHSNNTCDIYKDTPPKLNADKFIKETLVHVYTKLYERSTEEPSESVAVLLESLSHVLIAFHNIPSEKNLFSSAIEGMLDMGCLSAAVKAKDMLLSLLAKECDAFQRGIQGSSGSKLIFVDPSIRISFATIGVSGVLKCLNCMISKVEYQVLPREEQTRLMHMMIIMQSYLSESVNWNGEYEHIYLHCRNLQSTLEKKLGFQMADIKLDSDTETANDGSIIQLHENFLADSSTDSSQTSHSKLQPCGKVSSGVDVFGVDDWMVDTRNISKLRKGYAHELSNAGGSNRQNEESSWVSRWAARVMEYFVNCGKCCQVKD